MTVSPSQYGTNNRFAMVIGTGGLVPMILCCMKESHCRYALDGTVSLSVWDRLFLKLPILKTCFIKTQFYQAFHVNNIQTFGLCMVCKLSGPCIKDIK